MKKTGLKRYVYDFSVNYDSIDVDDIVDTHKYLMKKDDIKCLDLLTKTFIGLLRVCTIENFGKSLTFNSKRSIKCVFLNNQPRKARPTWKPWWKIFFYSFTVRVTKCDRSCNTIDNPHACVCVLNGI